MAELLDQTVLVFKGPVVGKTSYASMAGAKLQYIGNTFAAWPVEWNPVPLIHRAAGSAIYGPSAQISTSCCAIVANYGRGRRFKPTTYRLVRTAP